SFRIVGDNMFVGKIKDGEYYIGVDNDIYIFKCDYPTFTLLVTKKPILEKMIKERNTDGLKNLLRISKEEAKKLKIDYNLIKLPWDVRAVNNFNILDTLEVDNNG
ncbi:MAG: hypothetical protein QXX30_04400, partial [Candidatus Aenigmatarchaeota archaeon]